MPEIAACPDVQRYRQMIVGQLDAAEAEGLVAHLEGCDACAANIASIAEQDTLVDLIRQASTQKDSVRSERLTLLIERLRKQQPAATHSGQEERTLPPQTKPAPLSFRCSECGKNLKVKESLAGKKVKCPHCQKTVQAPAAQGEEKTMPPRDTATRTAGPNLPDAGTISANSSPGAGDPVAPPENINAELIECLAPAQAPDELGRLGPYRILKILGAGGMGVVYKAEDPQLKRLVALKAMLPSLGASSSAKKRFLREAQSAAAIKHDHIVTIHQVGEERGVPFLAMEFLKGEPLDERLKREEKLPLAEVLRIGREMADGLAGAHEAGLIHRDIKPANVWLEARGEGRGASKGSLAPHPSSLAPRVKILDFGLARAADEQQNLTQSGAIIGTPAYMAPEQAKGKKCDHRCDLFSLGVVLYRLCTGKQPFKGEDTVSTLMAVATEDPPAPILVDPELPQELSDLVMKLLEKNPDDRLGSANEAVEILQGLEKAQGEPSPVRGRLKTQKKNVAPQTPERAVAPRRRRLAPLFIVAAGFASLCLALGSGVVFFWPTANGVVRVEISDPSIKVAFDNKELSFEGIDKQDIKVAAGPHGLFVRHGNLEFATEKFQVKKGDTVIVKIELLKDGKLQVVQGDKVIGTSPLAKLEKSPGGAGEVKGPPTARSTFPPLDPAWLKAVAEKPAKEQVAAVNAELKDRNPGFGGVAEHQVSDRMVTEIHFSGKNVADISPVRALPGLKVLVCVGGKLLSDLSPLKGMTLTQLTLTDTKVSDLTPLKGMKLIHLNCQGTLVSDLEPLTGMPLTVLHCGNSRITDLSPLKDLPLKQLNIWSLSVSNPAPLKGLKLTTLGCVAVKVADLAWLKDMPLKTLQCDATLAVRNAEILRSTKTLETINGKGAKQFWNEVDAKTAPIGPPAKNSLVMKFQGHTDGIYTVALSADAKRVLTGSGDGTAILWDAANGKKIQTYQDHKGGVALSADAKLVLTGSLDATAILWEAAKAEKIKTFQGTRYVKSVALSGDGKRALVGYGDGSAILWDATDGKKIQAYHGHGGEVFGVALNGDASRALTGSSDTNTIFWEANTGKKIQTFPGPSHVRSVALSGDGKLALAGYGDNIAILWDAVTGAKIRTFKGHIREVFAVALSSDAKLAVTGSEDGTTILWDAANGNKLQTFKGHTAGVFAVALSADGKHVLTGSWDSTAILWAVDAASITSLPPLKKSPP